ncbi:MAG: pyridoxamine 5'-phosphate oxidase family protein [Dehalococcoidia bacterium]
MSVQGVLRREDRAMSKEETVSFLEEATVMRLGTIDREGWPYVVPLSFDYRDGKVYFHHTSEESHLTSCLEASPRVCIEVDESGPVLSYGDTACDTSRVYTSVVAFGRASLVSDTAAKERILNNLIVKYFGPESELSGSYSKLDVIHVFQIDIDIMTGKKRPHA